MEKLIIPGAVEGEVDPPSSKSYAQRAIAAALLADGVSVLSGIEGCDDTDAALRVVQALGARVENPAHGTYSITGGLKPVSDTLDIGESGLSTRLFTPIAALCPSPVTITGHGSILTRPMDMMLDPLRTLGVEVRARKGRLPITVRGPMRGGEVEIDGSVSSQFLTGLLVALPLASGDTTVRVHGLRSIPYIDMTIAMMDRFGVDVDHRDYEEFYIPGGQRYTPAQLTIEGDWSAASCLLVAGATAGSVTVRNLNPVSLQADVAIIEALSRAGAHIEQTTEAVRVSRRELRAFSFDATDCPDLFPALAALAASCDGTSTIIGTSRLAHKESDRAEAIRSEYGRLGIEVDISEPDMMRITGSPIVGDVTVDSHGDHRMAMSLAVAALNASSAVKITGAGSVSKSYADFWTDYEQLRK
jgi:3-phosphoshikimate 1-carboxyvinyltransferase